MTPEQFLQFADPLPEPTLLVSGSGFVLAVNRAAQHRLGLHFDAANQTSLASFVAESSDEVAQFLRRCSSSRQMVLGALTLQRSGGEPIACRAEGAVVRPRQDQSEAILLLRLLPKAAVVGQFLALNEQVSNLNKEILRRRETEEALQAAKRMAASHVEEHWRRRNRNRCGRQRRIHEPDGREVSRLDGRGSRRSSANRCISYSQRAHSSASGQPR